MTSGTIYLSCAVIGALNTVNAWRPFARDGRLSLIWYLAGMLTSELPLQAIGWQVVATVGFILAGALTATTGIVGLAISVVSWLGLIGLYRVAGRSGTVYEAALRGALGDAYAETIAARARPEDAAPPSARQVAAVSRGARKRYCVDRDVAYGEAGKRNELDVWRRADLPSGAAAPVLLQVHGGAWSTGRKDFDAGPLLTHLAERGWVCVAMNYRLSPGATWPDHIVDVKRAIAWIRSHIASYGGDPSFIAITGGSSGGHLAALAGLSGNDPAFQPGFETADTSVAAVVSMYGLFDLTGREGHTREDTMKFLATKVFKTDKRDDAASWEAASPICRVREDAPPFLVVHGTNDSFLPVEQARAFVAAMQATSTAPVAFAELPRTQHGFDPFASLRVHHSVRAIERFLSYVYETRQAPMAAEPAA